MASQKQPGLGADDKGGSTELLEYVDPKRPNVDGKDDGSSDLSSAEPNSRRKRIPTTGREIVAEVLRAEDDPTINPWTFRMWFIGIGLSVFASTITTINTFRPQAVHIHTVFVVVISYIFGRLMARFLPSKGAIGRIINPGPFNKKEHSAICIMTAAASSTPEAMSVLAVQKLWYDINPNPAIGVFLILSTQMLGYGVAGILRTTLVYPSKMFYPANLPTASLLENLHRDKLETKKKMRVFYISFAVLFCWQAFPTYIMPVLSGISIFCLTNQKSLMVTNIFGGSMANEGLGLLSLSFDWNMITGGGNPLWLPFQTLVNSMIGYLTSIGFYLGLFYSNYWNARSFPFISPLMFSDHSTSQKYIKYNQSAILDRHFRVDENLLKAQGLPNLTSAHAFAMVARNIGIMATITHMSLFHWDDIKSAFAIISSSQFKAIFKPWTWDLRFWRYEEKVYTDEEADAICPHFRLMQAYKEVPAWWFAAVWIISATVGLSTSILAQSTLPWWAFFLALAISASSLTFFAALTAMFGFSLLVQPLIQMIGAYVVPGRPIANMYFATFGFNSLYQAKFMLKDLKLGQYVHLAPRCTFAMQIIGTVIGCSMSYINMQRITTEKRDVLLAIQGTNVWSGQMLQSQNSAAVGWGGLAKFMYSPGAKYQWVSLSFILGLLVPVPFWVAHKLAPKLRIDFLNTAIITSALTILDHGTHSALLLHYATGFFSQLYLRKRHVNWFIKYNYILSAGMDGGSAVIAFILTFSVFGAGGKVVPFPPWAGNNWQRGNYDFCMRDPGLGAHRSH